MERSRPAPALSAEEVLSLPAVLDVSDPVPTAAPSPRERLETLRSGEATRGYVTFFVEELTQSLGPGETPRQRADVLLEVLEDASLCGLTTRDNTRVGVAALEALQALGYPYALEVTPAMLAHARQAQWNTKLWPSTLLGVGLAVACYLPLTTFGNPSRISFDSTLLLGPVLAAAFFREVGALLPNRFFRAAHRFFNGVQWLLFALIAIPTLITLGANASLDLPWLTAVTFLPAWFLRRGPPAAPPKEAPGA